MAEKIREGKVRCSFCQKTEDQVRKLIAGPDGAYICDECVGICSEIMEEEFGGYDQEDILGSEINLMKPEEIHAILDDYVIGQDEAKESTFCCCIQSLQTCYCFQESGCRASEEQYPYAWTNWFR